MLYKFDPQDEGAQYLEDLATGYWNSQALYTAVELELFDHLDDSGLTANEVAGALDLNPLTIGRFLHALCILGLLTRDGEKYYNTRISSKYLVTGMENYQGNSILWRKRLVDGWQGLTKCLQAGGRVDYGQVDEDPKLITRRIRKYISAMDSVARTKAQELLPIFDGLSLSGQILDVGAGSGAVSAGFLQHFPEMSATLMDIPEVLEHTAEFIGERGLSGRVTLFPQNILEAWPQEKESFDLIILSNIIHAFSEEEVSQILEKSFKCLKSSGLILIHDFFLEHFPEKAALFDLNMFVNTYNGKVFSHQWVDNELTRLKMFKTGLIPLKSDTAAVIAAKQEEVLAGLNINPVKQLQTKIKALGFRSIRSISPETIQVTNWAQLKCQFGCSGYGKGHCPPNAPSPEKTRDVLSNYTSILLLEGQPPTREFQQLMLEAEKTAFKAGYHKAFVYWAGPCSICAACAGSECRNTRDARPSMESAGIDVFETVRRAGHKLKTLSNGEEFVKYFGLLLLE